MVLRFLAHGNRTLDNRLHFSCCRSFGNVNADGAIYRHSDHLLSLARLLGHHLHTVGLFSLALAFCPFEIEEQVHPWNLSTKGAWHGGRGGVSEMARRNQGTN